jgi:hypothetical protein
MNYARPTSGELRDRFSRAVLELLRARHPDALDQN